MTTKTTKKATRRVRIPADLLIGGSGVVVAIRFPDKPTAHRIVRVTLPPPYDRAPSRIESRPACKADVPAGRMYEISAGFADARGATACTRPACFGGTP